MIDIGRGELRVIRMPRDDVTLVRKYWTGESWQLGTAAFWEDMARESPMAGSYRLGATLAEELVACQLGGYGVPSEMAAAAFSLLKQRGVFQTGGADLERWVVRLLALPLDEFGYRGRYRFPLQKGRRIAAALQHLNDVDLTLGDRDLRDSLLQLPGVGLKTASWVVRNYRASPHVAIIDVHVVRAGIAAGVFDPAWKPASSYALLERAFVAWAGQAGIPASHLDACIWGYLSRIGVGARDVLGVAKLSETPRPAWMPEVQTEEVQTRHKHLARV